MAYTYGEYIEEDWLEVTKDSTSTEYVSELYITSASSTTAKRIKRIYANDNENNATIVWDIWDYWLESEDFDIPSLGGSVKSYIWVDSFGTDVEGDNHNMSYSVSPTTIDKNTSDYDVEHRIKVTQSGSGDYVYVYATQSKRIATDVIYGTPTVEDAYIEVAPAGGGTVYLLVNWKQSVTILYDNDTTEEDGYVYGSSEATVLTLGNKMVTGCSIDDGGVYVPSAGSLVDSAEQKYCCNITKYSFEANGVTATKSGATIPVNREKNTVTYEYYVWVGTPSPRTIDGAGGVFYVDAECSERKIFTSGHETSWGSSSANVSYANGASGVTSFSGTKNITVNVGENISGSRYPRVTVTASNDSSEYDYASAYQEEVSYTLTAGSNQECNGDATNVNVSFVSSRNGKPYAPTIKSGSSWASITSVTSSGSTYYAAVSVGANPNSSTRDVDITATQTRYNGNASKSLTITQAGKAVYRPKFKVEILELMYTDGTLSKVSYDIRLTAYPSSEYNGGTASNLRVVLNTKKDGTGTNIVNPKLLASSVTVDRGGTSDPYKGTLDSNGNFCYFLVYWDDKLQFASEIEENTDMPDI